MKCGHTAQAHDEKGKPVCAICMCEEVDNERPNLAGRIARCTYNCGHKTDSSFNLPFFRHNPDKEYDSYFCGCEGWD